jgi:epoxyqueuosine reductase
MLDIKQRALEIGFDLAGVAPLAAWHDLEFSRRWVERGFGGEMRYLANPRRQDPRSILPSAQSVVCVGLVYNAPLAYSTEVANRPLTSGPSPQGGGVSRKASLPSPLGRGWHREAGTGEGARAWISRYAWGQDYHEIMRAKLETLLAEIEKASPGVETRVFVDTGPIVERAFARLSGIGWMGKNTCLINERKGSWFFLGVILTNLVIEPDLPAPDRCGSCTACLEACPTGALVKPYVMDASRCISYLNIELKGSIPEEFRAAMGNNLFGCDICQDVCPWNSRQSSVVSRQLPVARRRLPELKGSPRFPSSAQQRRRAATTTAAEFQPITLTVTQVETAYRRMGTGKQLAALGSGINQQSAIEHRRFSTDYGPRTTDYGPRTEDRVSSFEFRISLFNPPLETLASLGEDDFRRVFAHSPIKRARYRGWLRNLCVAMGNSGDARFVPRLQELSAHADPLVREHAAWALARLRGVSRPDRN